jgi:hypothetical protein
MIHGDTSHAPGKSIPIADEDMDKFIQKMRLKRNTVESNLKYCEDPEARQAMMLKIEQYNMIITEFGYEAYGKKTKAKF